MNSLLKLACLAVLSSQVHAAASSSFVNVSSRAVAGTGENAQITGFAVRAAPSELRWVLVRSIGPTLADFGVSNPLADPSLVVRDRNGTAIAANDNWGDAPNLELLTTVTPLAGAFSVSNPKEAAVLVGVATGEYTSVASGKTDTLGVVLSEAYEVGTVAEGTASQTLSGIAAGNPNFTILATALRVTGLDVALAGGGSLTVFAPTDAAFAKLPEGTLEYLVAHPAELADILKYHVVGAKVLSTDLENGQVAATLLEGASLTVDLTDGVKINSSNVIAADVMAVNGVIHVIDTVLLPPAK